MFLFCECNTTVCRRAPEAHRVRARNSFNYGRAECASRNSDVRRRRNCPDRLHTLSIRRGKEMYLRSGRSPDWLKMKNPECAAVKPMATAKAGNTVGDKVQIKNLQRQQGQWQCGNHS